MTKKQELEEDIVGVGDAGLNGPIPASGEGMGVTHVKIGCDSKNKKCKPQTFSQYLKQFK